MKIVRNVQLKTYRDILVQLGEIVEACKYRQNDFRKKECLIVMFIVWKQIASSVYIFSNPLKRYQGSQYQRITIDKTNENKSYHK